LIVVLAILMIWPVLAESTSHRTPPVTRSQQRSIENAR